MHKLLVAALAAAYVLIAAPPSAHAQDEIPVPPPIAAPHEQIAHISDVVASLTADGTLTHGQSHSLGVKLESATESLRMAQPAVARRWLRLFRQELGGLAKGFIVPATVAGELADASVTAENTIGTLAEGWPSPFPDPKEYCRPGSGPCHIAPCSIYVSYYVDIVRGRGANADGSEASPFRFINDALRRATGLGVCGVDLTVAGGTYPEDVTVSRHTRIHGGSRQRAIIAGTISNTGPYEVQIDHVTLSPTFGGMGIFVDHPCAVTRLTDVDIEGATGYGVRHKGGALTAVRTSVVRTRAEPDYTSRGTAIYVSCGARASLLAVAIDRNESGGLLLSGRGTIVAASLLFVTRTGVNPYYGVDEPVGAVRAQNNAHLSTEFAFIDENDLVGLVSHSGGRIDFHDGAVSHTRSVAPVADECSDPCGGTNVQALENGSIEMTNFISSHADLCGIQLALGGQIDLHDGDVARNVIGVNMQVEGFDLSRLMDGVRYIDNDLTLDSVFLPIPDVGDIEP